MKHIACNSSLIASRPADRRTCACGIMSRATAITRTKSNGSTPAFPCSGVPGICTSWLIGTLSGCVGRFESVMSICARSRSRLAHAEDAAAAHLQAGVAHGFERVQSVLERARRDDLVVVLRRGIDVVVVVVEAGVLQLDGLVGREHAERGARLHAERAHFANHLGDGGDLLRLGRAIAAPMQKRVAPASFARRAESTTWPISRSVSRSRPVS